MSARKTLFMEMFVALTTIHDAGWDGEADGLAGVEGFVGEEEGFVCVGGDGLGWG